MNRLEKYYPGDENWTVFFKLYDADISNPVFKELLDRLRNNNEIAKVIYVLLGESNCLAWINKKLPVLNNRTVMDCIDHGEHKTIKTMLMRM